MRPYPDRNGIAIPTCELELPPSKLDLELYGSWNNHHKQFPYKRMGMHIILETFRDLVISQELLPLDVHARLHQDYGPPKLPTLKQASDAIMVAWERGGEMKIKAKLAENKVKPRGGYEIVPISATAIEIIRREYSRY